jgi:hypothetical protein
MDISEALHLAQCTKVCIEVSFSRNIVGGLGMPLNLKILPLGQQRDILKTAQTENYSTDGHRTAQSCCARGAYHRQKFGY